MSDSSSSCDLSLIICCYNEEEILDGNFRKVISYLDSINFTYELIVVDDCSRDNTRRIIESLVQEYSTYPIKVIYHEQNRGRGGAVKTGINSSAGTVVGFIDIDLEVPEWYILPCVKKILEDETDIATGYRTYKLHFSFFILIRHILSHGYRKLIRLFLETSILDTETGYKFFHREKILPLVAQTRSDHWFWDTEIMLLSEKQGLKIEEVPCLFIRNPDKTSTVKIFKDSLGYLKEVISFKKRIKSQFN